jgi:hypothetical protein
MVTANTSWLVFIHPPQTSSTMASAEIHDLYDSILILDFGSQVRRCTMQ